MQPSVSLVASFTPNLTSSPEEIRAAVPKYVAKILASLRAGEIVLSKDSGWGKLEVGDTLSVQDLVDPRARAAVAKMALALAKSEIKTGGSPQDLPQSKAFSPPNRPALPRKQQPRTDQLNDKLNKTKLTTSRPPLPSQPADGAFLTPSYQPQLADIVRSTSSVNKSHPKSSSNSKPLKSDAPPPDSGQTTQPPSPTRQRDPSSTSRGQDVGTSSRGSSAIGSRRTSPYMGPLPSTAPESPSFIKPTSAGLLRSNPTPMPPHQFPSFSCPPTPVQISRSASPKYTATVQPPSPQVAKESIGCSVPPSEKVTLSRRPSKRLVPEPNASTGNSPARPPLFRSSTDNTSTRQRSAGRETSDSKFPTKNHSAQSTPSLLLTPMIISLPYITLHIHNRPVRFLCDTGSMLNLMSPSVRERLELSIRISPGTVMGVTGASICEGVCEGEDGRGVVMESVQHKSSCKARFVVGPTGQSDCILGMPFFVENRAEIRYVPGKGTLITFQAERSSTSPTGSRKKTSSSHRVTIVATDELQVRRGYEWPAQASQAHISASAMVPPEIYGSVYTSAPSFACSPARLSQHHPSIYTRRSYSISSRPVCNISERQSLYRLEATARAGHSPTCSTSLTRNTSGVNSSTSWKFLTRLGAKTFEPNR